MTKKFGPFLIVLSSVTSLKKQFKGSTSCFDKYTITVEHMGAFFRTWDVVENTNFWKKGNCFSEKNYMNNFSSFIEYDRPQKTFYSGPRVSLAINVGVIRSTLYDLGSQ